MSFPLRLVHITPVGVRRAGLGMEVSSALGATRGATASGEPEGQVAAHHAGNVGLVVSTMVPAVLPGAAVEELAGDIVQVGHEGPISVGCGLGQSLALVNEK